jgi:hypothetical protein
MLKAIKLIELYCAVCRYYDTVLAAEAQRMSNNYQPLFTDSERMTIYLFGISEGMFTMKAAYEFVRDYFPGWFPRLPSYQAFNYRICRLSGVFKELCGLLISGRAPGVGSTFLIDSLPVFVANGKRSGTARAAPGLCAKSYCASQNKWYYGVKVHVLGQKVYHTLPNMMAIEAAPANESDISVAKEMLLSVYNITAFADKAYGSQQWQEELEKQGIRIYTPVKLEKGRQYLKSADHYFSQLVSQARQAIESFFNWLNEKTHIQSASKARSENGLIAFIFARLAVVAVYP